MSINKKDKAAHAVVAALLLGASSSALAQDGGFFADLWDNTIFQGVIRADAAYRTTSYQNPNNQTNAPFQDVLVPRQAFLPPDLAVGLVNWGDVPLTVIGGVSIPTLLEAATPGRRSDVIPQEDLEFNLATIRFTGEMNMVFSQEWRMNVRLRALYDPVIYDEFNAADVAGVQGGYSTTGGDRYADAGKPNYYEALDRNGKRINPLELAGRDYMVDLPTFIINYKKGGWDFRFGNQTIAWGQAIFFRTFDVANGLDLRRHLVIDRAIEEFEDERVPKIALRVAGQITDTMVLDSYVGKFQPDILTNPNTPYNVIPSQFYKPFDNYYVGDYDSKIDYGVRLKSDYGSWGWQAMAVSRYNPLGAFKWAESGIVKGLTPHGGLIAAAVHTAYAAKPPCLGAQNPYDNFCRLYGGVAEALSHTPFAVAPGGLYSDREWFAGAASVRLHGVDALNTVINEFPAVRDLFASPVDNVPQASALLNTFFLGAGGSLMGHVERDYFREEVFAIGGSYVNESEDIESFWSQFITNIEVQYTPERVLTATSLSRDYDKTDEYIVTLVGEKWFRYSESFPAAYLVFQGMHRSATDLVGLNLDGYGGNVGGGNIDINDPIVIADGISSANYLVFAGFQPWPNRKYILEWAFLYDVKGGLLAQPLVKWNPGYKISVDLYYNYTDGELHGDGTDNLIRAIDFADEIGLRISYEL
ncbi:DUF1302 family protein [Panacagrimonas sp.]|uniref:DUF1302 family protein n=1 Tax=Panacagrimonas sp. TaxID=2480088 RepID=UPI003B523A9B